MRFIFLQFDRPPYLRRQKSRSLDSIPTANEDIFDLGDLKKTRTGNPDLDGSFTVTKVIDPKDSQSAADDLPECQLDWTHESLPDIREYSKPRVSFSDCPRQPTEECEEEFRQTTCPKRRQSLLTDSRGRLKTLVDKVGVDGSVRKVSVASVIGHDLFKKLYAAELVKISNKRSSGDGSGNSAENSDGEESLPESPRFGATLSAQGQVATLKGYEDILHDSVEEQYSPLVRRKQTPKVRLLTGSSLPGQSKDDTEIGQHMSRDRGLNARRLSLHLDEGMNLLDHLRKDKADMVTLTGKGKSSLRGKEIVKAVNVWEESWRHEFSAV